MEKISRDLDRGREHSLMMKCFLYISQLRDQIPSNIKMGRDEKKLILTLIKSPLGQTIEPERGSHVGHNGGKVNKNQHNIVRG